AAGTVACSGNSPVTPSVTASPASSTATASHSGSGRPDDHGDHRGNEPGDDRGHDAGGDRDNDRDELTGVIADKGGVCPTLTFSIGTTTVTTDLHTTFDDTSCNALANGNRVEVKGAIQANRSLLASRVEKKK